MVRQRAAAAGEPIEGRLEKFKTDPHAVACSCALLGMPANAMFITNRFAGEPAPTREASQFRGTLNDEPGQAPRTIRDGGSIADSQHLGYQITHHVRREHPFPYSRDFQKEDIPRVIHRLLIPVIQFQHIG
jgi:hypothetical protein